MSASIDRGSRRLKASASGYLRSCPSSIEAEGWQASLQGAGVSCCGDFLAGLGLLVLGRPRAEFRLAGTGSGTRGIPDRALPLSLDAPDLCGDWHGELSQAGKK